MRGTTIVYAKPGKLMLMEKYGRFGATRQNWFSRAVAAWLVFTGRADALCWDFWDEDDAGAI